jgi:hypothetical protein
MDRTVTPICNSQAPSSRPSSVHLSAQISLLQRPTTTRLSLQREVFSRQ